MNTLRKLNINGHIGLISCTFSRNGHHMRGKPPGIAKSLEQKIKEWDYKDPSIHFRVDIGLPPTQVSRSKKLQERLEILKKNRTNPELERLARNKKLFINLDQHKNEWFETAGQHQIKAIADHYGVYQHLFGDAYFFPRVPFTVLYETSEGQLPVYYGNTMKPSDAKNKPQIKFEASKDSLWSLILTNPDGHFKKNDSEYLHWFIGNIPGCDVNKGETIIEYLQPFPPKGTGYHRFIFILYKQEKKIDFSHLKKNGPCLNLNERTFSTYDFYKNLQDDLTPASLSFFQSDWDSSLKEFFHNTLKMKEPIFEYDFLPPYIRKQEWFPKRRPFNIYMDKYRDPKQINKEFLMKKLKDAHPFRGPKPELPYPNAQNYPRDMPSWLKLEVEKSRLKWGRINEIE